MSFSVAGVHKPLAAVCKIVDAGHTVVMGKKGSYIEHGRTKERTTLQRKAGVYVMPGVRVLSLRTAGSGGEAKSAKQVAPLGRAGP